MSNSVFRKKNHMLMEATDMIFLELWKGKCIVITELALFAWVVYYYQVQYCGVTNNHRKMHTFLAHNTSIKPWSSTQYQHTQKKVCCDLLPPSAFIRHTRISKFKHFYLWLIIWQSIFFLFRMQTLYMIGFVIKYSLQWL